MVREDLCRPVGILFCFRRSELPGPYFPLIPSFISPLMLLSTSATPVPTFLAASSVLFNISVPAVLIFCPSSEPTALIFCFSSPSAEPTLSPALFSTEEAFCPKSEAADSQQQSYSLQHLRRW